MHRRGGLAAGHRAEDSDVAHAEPLAETEDHIAVSPYLVQGDGAPRSLSAQYRLPSPGSPACRASDLDDFDPGHGVIVGVLGHDRDAVRGRGGGGPAGADGRARAPVATD